MTLPDESNQEPRVSAEVASALGGLSRWGDDHSEPWRAALAKARPPTRSFRLIPPSYIGGIAAVLMVAVLVGILLPSLGKARSSRSVPPSTSPEVASSRPSKLVQEKSEIPFSSSDATLRAPESLAYMGAQPSTVVPLQPHSQGVAQDRQVIRKATIELKSKTVRAVFAKATQVLSEANGEYVESSSLTGDEEEEVQAQMTLRVTASRLSTVLNQLRDLGIVVNESSSGEDVTDTVVDLEARLRNEQRVEAELLQLLESRKDAPLKEILDLRSEIASVRISIERLTGQRERLGRMVSLATVLVIIHPDTTKPSPLPDGIGDYFLRQVRRAWQGSLALLTDSVALLIQVFVGGAVFWIAGLAILLTILTIRRRSLRRMEPAPRL